MRKYCFLLALLFFTSSLLAQQYYKGKITSTATSYNLSKKKNPKKRKSKIFVRQTINQDSIQLEVIIKRKRRTIRQSKTYFRYNKAGANPPFRLFVKNQENPKQQYIRKGTSKEVDFYDGLFRSLLPDYEFYHEKVQESIAPEKVTGLYNISFEFTNSEEQGFMHKLYFSKSLKMESFLYIANGKANTQQQTEVVNIETNYWQGSAARPFSSRKQFIELGKVRKRKKKKRIKALFEGN